VWIVVTAIVSAAAGVLLGTTLAPRGAQVMPRQPSDTSIDIQDVLAAIQDLREDLKLAERNGLEAPPAVMAERQPVESDTSSDVEELRALVAELRGIAEGANCVAEPPPVSALRGAREKDLDAVRSACSGDHQETMEELLYQSYQVVLARFGRPDGIDEKGRMFWSAKWNKYIRKLAVTVRESFVVNVEWVPFDQ